MSRTEGSIVFAVAAGPRMGFGHLMRSRSLARALGVPWRVCLRGSAATRRIATRLGAELVTSPLARTSDPVGLLVVDDPSRREASRWVASARHHGVPVASIHDRGLGEVASDLVVDGSVYQTPPPGMSLAAYRDSVLERFSNPAINDQLARIASDGATKIPVFLADTIKACLARGGDHRRLAFLLTAFTRYLATGTAQEPRLSAADLALAGDADPAAPLRIGTFDGLGLAEAPAFVRSYVDLRRRIAASGVLGALGGLQAEAG